MTILASVAQACFLSNSLENVSQDLQDSELDDSWKEWGDKFMQLTQWKRSTGKEERKHAKNYAKLYASFIPSPGWSIADQYVLSLI
jgi:hypothetical protein